MFPFEHVDGQSWRNFLDIAALVHTLLNLTSLPPGAARRRNAATTSNTQDMRRSKRRMLQRNVGIGLSVDFGMSANRSLLEGKRTSPRQPL
jgi:hypothetical protein